MEGGVGCDVDGLDEAVESQVELVDFLAAWFEIERGYVESLLRAVLIDLLNGAPQVDDLRGQLFAFFIQSPGSKSA